MIQNIFNEMIQGNFSFAILVVGILQLREMQKKNNPDKVSLLEKFREWIPKFNEN